MAAQLIVRSARGKSWQLAPDVSQSHHHDAARRTVARCLLELRDMGRNPWRMARTRTPRASAFHILGATSGAPNRCDVRCRVDYLGVLSCPDPQCRRRISREHGGMGATGAKTA